MAMEPYWPRAKEHAAKRTEKWSPLKAIPGIIAVLLQFGLDLQTRDRAAMIALSAILGYAVVFLIEYLRNLLLTAPVALDADRQNALIEKDDQIRRLWSEISELKTPRPDPGQQQLRRVAEAELADFSPAERRMLEILLERPKWERNALAQRIRGKSDFRWEDFAALLAARNLSVLLSREDPTAVNHQTFHMVNPIYAETVRQLLAAQTIGPS